MAARPIPPADRAHPPVHSRPRPAAAPPPSNRAANDFPAVPINPARPYDQIHALYLHREPELLAAIRCGDRGEARKIINHILVHIYAAGEERNELLKGLLLELVVGMARAAVECGASQTEVLGLNFTHLGELAGIHDDEALAGWLSRTFEHIFAVIGRHSSNDEPPQAVRRALAWMRANLQRDLTREEVARESGVSPGHLTELLRQHTGRAFSESLRLVRIEAACALLHDTDRKISDIATACGFCDQSHFTHVFRATRGMTPRQYRHARTAI